MDLADEMMQFFRKIDSEFPRQQVVVGVISGIATYICLASGYFDCLTSRDTLQVI